MFKYLSSMIFLLMLSISGFANNQATLFIEGHVPLICSLMVTPELTATDTPLDIIAGETGTKIGTLTESFNGAPGYLIDVHSANAGNLQNAAGANAPYTIEYVGGSAGVTPPAAAPGTGNLFNSGPLALAVVDADKDILITIPATPVMAGYYTDTLIFTMSAL